MDFRMPPLDAHFGSVLADLCEEAADLVRPLWKSGLTVDRKLDDSPVTEADRRAEALILEGLARIAPGVAVISEEHASEFGAPGSIGRVLLHGQYRPDNRWPSSRGGHLGPGHGRDLVHGRQGGLQAHEGGRSG